MPYRLFFKTLFMQFYKEVTQKVPVDKINNFIKMHGFQPLDPSKVTANQVASTLQYIVELHGLEAYQELENLLASETNTKSLPSSTEIKAVKNCDCDCQNCNLNRKGNRDSIKEKETKVENILKDKQSLLIIAATAVVLALILKR